MRKILSTLFCIATFFGCINGPEESAPTGLTNQAVAASTVTVAIPTEAIIRYDALNVPVPPPWGFFSIADNFFNTYIPISGIPIGSVVNKVQARVLGTTNNVCIVDLWRMNDFFSMSASLGSARSALVSTPSTLTIDALSVPVQSLKKLYLSFHALAPADDCDIMAAEVTYTPPL